MTRVGVVGLGEMGGTFVERLLAAGRAVTGWNRTRSKAAHLIERGMQWAASPAEVAAQSDVIITMVTNATALDAVSTGSDGLLAAMPGKILIEMTTCAPVEVVHLANRVHDAGGELIDAAVLGSPLTVRQGNLVIVVTGADAAIETGRPILTDIGPRVVAMGEIGKAVTFPPNPAVYRAANTEDTFVQFDVPESALRSADGETAKIYSPNSVHGRHYGVMSMPSATNITIP